MTASEKRTYTEEEHAAISDMLYRALAFSDVVDLALQEVEEHPSVRDDLAINVGSIRLVLKDLASIQDQLAKALHI